MALILVDDAGLYFTEAIKDTSQLVFRASEYVSCDS
jgi:hypothetical protein